MKKIIILIFPTLIFFCCNNDPFYNYKGWGYTTVPLIKPYYAFSLLDGNNRWIIYNEPYGNTRYKIIEVSHLMVTHDSIIIVFDDKVRHGAFDRLDTCWGFIVSRKKIHFRSYIKDEFLDSLRCYTMENLKFRSIWDVQNELHEKGYLPWYPEEYKN